MDRNPLGERVHGAQNPGLSQAETHEHDGQAPLGDLLHQEAPVPDCHLGHGDAPCAYGSDSLLYEDEEEEAARALGLLG